MTKTASENMAQAFASGICCHGRINGYGVN